MRSMSLIISIRITRIIWFVTILFMFLSCGSRSEDNGTETAFSLLLFSKTTEFRHDSISIGITAIKTLAEDNKFRLTVTEDAGVFNQDSLVTYDAVIFLLTSGDVLNDKQQAVFKNYIQNGGGFVGIHSASDTEKQWDWFGQLVGAFITNHPIVQYATVNVEDSQHLSNLSLPLQWIRSDEWYNFDRNPASNVNVLLTVDESTYSGGMMGNHHPISWYQIFDGGRSWYTAMGHGEESYRDRLFLTHLLGGIKWVAGKSN